MEEHKISGLDGGTVKNLSKLHSTVSAVSIQVDFYPLRKQQFMKVHHRFACSETIWPDTKTNQTSKYLALQESNNSNLDAHD